MWSPQEPSFTCSNSEKLLFFFKPYNPTVEWAAHMEFEDSTNETLKDQIDTILNTNTKNLDYLDRQQLREYSASIQR